MEAKCCRNCEYYRQHYSIDGRKIFWVYCGHCTASRKVRQRKPDALACQQFAPVPPVEDEFVNKEYLSKALLQYMLRMELLPQIENAPEDKAE